MDEQDGVHNYSSIRKSSMLKRILLGIVIAYLIAGLPILVMGFIFPAAAGAPIWQAILFALFAWLLWPFIITGVFCG